MDVFLPAIITKLHEAFDDFRLPHAFGGAIALAYCGTPRATIDIDVNVFKPVRDRHIVLQALTSLFTIDDIETTKRRLFEDAQARFHWDDVPVDVFLSNLEFHNEMAERIRVVEFVDTFIPVLSAEDLIVCKAVFNRPKDWVDIEDIFKVRESRLDVRYIIRWLKDFCEENDERMEKIARLGSEYSGPDAGTA